MQSFMIALLTCTATMSLLALLYMALMPLLARHYSEKGRYYTWLIIVIGLIVPFRPHFDRPIVVLDVPTVLAGPLIQPRNVSAIVIPDLLSASPPAMPGISWWQAAFALWLLGTIAFLAYHTIRHYCFSKMASRWSEPIQNDAVAALFQSLKNEMGIHGKIELCLCSSITSPMMFGLKRPRILLPRDDFAQDELRFILKHELVHFKRKDLLYKHLVLIAAAIHWFNPIAHLIAKAIAAACESACDAEVIQNTDADTRQHYSETIIGVVRYQSKLKTALSTNFYGGKKGMKKRIFSIMDTNRKKAGMAILSLMLILTLGTGMAFAANGSWQTQRPPAMQDRLQNTTAVSDAYQSVMSRYDPATGQTFYSFDGGNKWIALTAQEYDAMFPTPEIEWWTYEGYEAWAKEHVAALQAMADDGVPDYYDDEDVLREFTQADVDEMAAIHQSILADIARGVMVSKSIDGLTGTAMSYDPDSTALNVTEAITQGTAYIDDRTEADVARAYEKYAPYGIVYQDNKVFMKGELVRCFDDWYSLGEGMQAGISHFDANGTVDVYALRDFSNIVRNADGSYDPSGKLVGVKAAEQAEFDKRDISSYLPGYAPPIQETENDSIQSAISIYEHLGVSYDSEAGMMMYQGLPVREIFNAKEGTLVTLSAGSGFPNGDTPENAIDLTCVYTGNVLTGLKQSTRAEFDMRTRERLNSVSEAIRFEAQYEGTAQASSVATQGNTSSPSQSRDTLNATAAAESTDGSNINGRTIAEIFEDYRAFGITFETESVKGGLGNIYYYGQLVKSFADVTPEGGVLTCGSADGGEIKIRTVYDENGKLAGVEVIRE